MASERKQKRKTLRDLLPKDIVVCDLKAAKKDDAIRELCDVLVIAGHVEVGKGDTVLEALLQRERVASTGIGNGMAIPHAKSKWVDKRAIAVGLCREGLEYGALDGAPVKMIVMVATPPSANKEHLVLMRALAGVARDEEQSRRLMQSRDRLSFLDQLEQVVVD